MAGYKDPPKEHQFKKGAPGKPKGCLNMKTRMINALLKKCDYPDLAKPGKVPTMIKGQMADMLIASLLNQAIKGNTKAAEILLERTEGRVPMAIEAQNENDEPITEIKINIIKPEPIQDES